MNPIIKWSGGKSQEIKFFHSDFPNKIDRYIEPFSGGAAVYFYLENKKSIINDVNFELISLYKLLSNEKERNLLFDYLTILSNQRDIFNNYFNENKMILRDIFDNKDISFLKKLNIIIKDKKTLEDLITKSVQDKIKRIITIENKENKQFSENELKDHLITALQSGLYYYSREIYNNGYNEDNDEDLIYYISNWYYVREFCYSSMFRFSKSGKFNVPYGGIGYNKKDFFGKIKKFKENKNLHKLLENTEINNIDFEDLFKKYNYFEKDDFIFLDPPYDSEFSQYNKEKDFDKDEQIRLRNSLLKVKARFMIVIKETDFINEIYSDSPVFKIKKFDKKYLTNMRNRNNKDVKHLIITNY